MHCEKVVIMNVRLIALSAILGLMAGCAAEAPQPAATGAAGRATFGTEPALSGALIMECRTPCSVSPGPGCC